MVSFLSISRLCRQKCASLGLLVVLWPAASWAQKPPLLSVDVATGLAIFVGESLYIEPLVAAATRINVSPRVSVGPEVVLIHGTYGTEHEHVLLTGNVTWNFVRPPGTSPRAAAGFLVL